MIYLYSGTPGSGKSYHAVAVIAHKLGRRDKNRVIANFPLTGKKITSRFEYWDNSEICISRLMQYAREHHRLGVEGQTLVVIDEAQCIFNSRDWNGKGVLHSALKRQPDSRMDWIKFFSQHRKFGYNVILIAQSDKMLDKQIRSLIEYDVKHIKMNNGFFFFLPTSFLAVEKWYGQRMKLGQEVIWYHKRVAAMYDSYALFDTLTDTDSAQGEPRSGGSPCAASAPPAETSSAQPVETASNRVCVAENAGPAARIQPVATQKLQVGGSDLAENFGPAAEVQPGEMREPLAVRIKTVIARLLRAFRLPCGKKCDLGTQQDARPEQQKGEG